MNDSRTAQSPIAIDRVERTRGDGDGIRLRLGGHRLTAAAEPELDALLVVRLHGRRHRFARSGDRHDDPAPGTWQASFTVPDWAVPVEYGQAALWVGEASVPVPPVGTRIRETAPAPDVPGPDPVVPPSPAAAATDPVLASPPPSPVVAHGAETGRSGPLAEALIRETVSALHAELEQRSAREAALDVALQRARAELEARTRSQAELETTQRELRAELSRLVAAVAEQRDEFERRRAQAREQEAGVTDVREQLAAVNERLAAALESDRIRAQEAASLREQLAVANISRDAAVAEAGGLRAELGRVGSELAVTRERPGTEADELSAAQQLLQDARALSARLKQWGEG